MRMTAEPVTAMLKYVIFLDRDGVINRDSENYVKSWEEFEFLPGSLDALARLTAAGHPLIVITNQSVIGRGMTRPEELDRMFDGMRQAVEAAGGRILDIFHCPHIPEDRCGCRKPAAGLIRQAVEKYTIDLSSSGFIGDSARDIQCAKAAGCAYSVLVRSGLRFAVNRQKLDELGIAPDRIAENLLDAAGWIIRNHGTSGDERAARADRPVL